MSVDTRLIERKKKKRKKLAYKHTLFKCEQTHLLNTKTVHHSAVICKPEHTHMNICPHFKQP